MKQPIKTRVDDLVSRMTLAEKVSQMSANAKAIERLGIEKYNWWNECLHGVARAGRATVFPQAIGLAATFNVRLVRRIARAISDEARAKHNAANATGNRRRYTGLTFWTPNINIFRDPRWGRGHETYGEDPYLTSRLAVAFIRGLQGDDRRYLQAAACAKHYAVHSGPEPLRHTFDARVSLRDMWDTFLPAFEAAVRDAKVEAVMGAYNRTNGQLCCAHPYLMGEVLRGKWDFGGHFVSDCGAIEDFFANHKVTKGAAESAALAVKAGCDLCCGEAYTQLIAAVERGLISEAEIDVSVKRLMTTRMKLGMFDPPARVPFSRIKSDIVDSVAHRRLALQAARESIVLLKNDGVLPLRKGLGKIVVCGANHDSVQALLGNYNGVSARMVTILEGITSKVDAGTVINELFTCPHVGPTGMDFGSTRWAASDADVIIAVLGLSPRIEGEEGDAASEAGGDRKTIELPLVQQEFLDALIKTGKQVVVVMVSGSAVASPLAAEKASAVLQVMYLGEEGGTAVADVLFGDYNPGGRLPFTIPASTDQLPPFEDYSMTNRTYRYMRQRPLYPFGHGLSYTSFRYAKARAKKRRDGTVDVQVEVTNTGKVAGDEVVQLYVRDFEASVPAANHSLRAFTRIHLKRQQKKIVKFTLNYDDFSIVNELAERVVEPGKFQVFIGGGQPGFAETVMLEVEMP